MGTARPLQKLNVDWEAKCRLLELRDQQRARELLKANAAVRAAQKAAAADRRLRIQAEQNASRFHALLLQERIRKL